VIHFKTRFSKHGCSGDVDELSVGHGALAFFRGDGREEAVTSFDLSLAFCRPSQMTLPIRTSKSPIQDSARV